MKKSLIVRYGEIALKGLNKSYFENKLIEHVQKNLSDLGQFHIKRSNGLIFIDINNYPVQSVIDRVIKVFGIASVSPAYELEADMETICKAAAAHMEERLKEEPFATFKVESRRGNKNFPLKSPEISQKVGGYVLSKVKGLKVDVHQPDLLLYVDVREKAYVYSEKIQGFGGLPLGTNGKAMLLLSGGIDSPVAGWMMAKRGVELEAVHYHSYPFTSQRATEKVMDLARILSQYCGKIRLHIVNLLPIQQAIHENCPEGEMTILSRRFMMKIAERIAREEECHALVTGESVGQVASQTMQSLVVTDGAVQLPVFRPLIALDKIDIIDIAKKIQTYETSILPYEDCCTVFLPKRPVTKPRMDKILESEEKLDQEELIAQAIADKEVYEIFLEDEKLISK